MCVIKCSLAVSYTQHHQLCRLQNSSQTERQLLWVGPEYSSHSEGCGRHEVLLGPCSLARQSTHTSTLTYHTHTLLKLQLCHLIHHGHMSSLFVHNSVTNSQICGYKYVWKLVQSCCWLKLLHKIQLSIIPIWDQSPEVDKHREMMLLWEAIIPLYIITKDSYNKIFSLETSLQRQMYGYTTSFASCCWKFVRPWNLHVITSPIAEK